MIEFYLIKKFLKEQFHFHLFELEHLIELERFKKSFDRAKTLKKKFDRTRTFTRTFDRGFVRGEYNDLKVYRLLLLLWRGKNDCEFFIIQLEK